MVIRLASKTNHAYNIPLLLWYRAQCTICNHMPLQGPAPLHELSIQLPKQYISENKIEQRQLQEPVPECVRSNAKKCPDLHHYRM